LLKDIKFNKDGLVPAIAQDADTGEVLMLAYMNAEALRRTLTSGEAWFFSRSRQELWHKGETSGSIIKVSEVWKDCDSDTILIKGKASGPVCHTGNKTCFCQQLTEKELEGSAVSLASSSSTALFSADIATSSWASSGSLVVSRCSHRLGAISTLTRALPVCRPLK